MITTMSYKRFASNAFNARRLPLALLVYTLVRPSVINGYLGRKQFGIQDFFEKQNLTGPNFIDWYRQLRIVLLVENKENYLEHPIPAAPVAAPGQQVPPQALAAHAAWNYIDNLERFGQPVSLRLAVSLILVSLSKEYDGFVQNYNMHSMGKTMNELHAMLKLDEQTLPKKDVAPTLHAIRAGKVQKKQKKKPHKAAKGNQGKGKAKMAKF
ncbi:hypothetical protein Tco_0625545 [Tanacetum coccineum]|uniref:Zinc finger, CCHC-type n=1 Tax=Tanacetum coccineum TaxID=301880 RepID=A0ABQ4WH28_9ASTR